MKAINSFLKLFLTGNLIIACLQTAWANPYYCTQTNQYINTGMSTEDVKQACGDPSNIQKSEKPATTRVPVTQLTFNVSTTTTGSYAGTVTPGIQSGAVQINSGPLSTLMVSVKNNQISKISLNGESVQSASVCGGSFGVGDSASAAINNCGAPSSQNDSYVNVKTGQMDHIELWTYQFNDNTQPPFQLTFVNGSLTQTPG